MVKVIKVEQIYIYVCVCMYSMYASPWVRNENYRQIEPFAVSLNKH